MMSSGGRQYDDRRPFVTAARRSLRRPGEGGPHKVRLSGRERAERNHVALRDHQPQERISLRLRTFQPEGGRSFRALQDQTVPEARRPEGGVSKAGPPRAHGRAQGPLDRPFQRAHRREAASDQGHKGHLAPRLDARELPRNADHSPAQASLRRRGIQARARVEGSPLGDDGAAGVGRGLPLPHGGGDPGGQRRLRAPPLPLVHRQLRPPKAVKTTGSAPHLLREPARAPGSGTSEPVRLSRRGLRRACLPQAETPFSPESEEYALSFLRRVAYSRERQPAGENHRDSGPLRSRPPLRRRGHARPLLRLRPDGRGVGVGGSLVYKPPVVILSGVRWDFLWQRHQTLATLFAGAGYPTVFVETTGLANPRLTGNTLRRVLGRVRRSGGAGEKPPAERNLTVYAPLTAPPTYGAFRWSNEKLLVPRIISDLRKIAGLHPVVVAYLPTRTTLGLISGLDPGLVLYDCSDDYEHFPGAPKDIGETERELFLRADLVSCTSARLLEKAGRLRPDAFPNGPAVDYERFAVLQGPLTGGEV